MAGMTKADRAEYESRLASLDYWTRLSHEQALAYGITSKRDFLAFYRAKDQAAKEELEAIEATKRLEEADKEDAIESAKEAASFQGHVAACEYMGEVNPKFAAWQEGPVMGGLRVAYVESHKAHAKALETGNNGLIESAWENYCKAKNAWTCAYYGGL